MAAPSSMSIFSQTMLNIIGILLLKPASLGQRLVTYSNFQVFSTLGDLCRHRAIFSLGLVDQGVAHLSIAV